MTQILITLIILFEMKLSVVVLVHFPTMGRGIMGEEKIYTGILPIPDINRWGKILDDWVREICLKTTGDKPYELRSISHSFIPESFIPEG